MNHWKQAQRIWINKIIMIETKHKVENKEQLFELLYANLDTIKSYGVSQFGVFGSFVRNEMNEDSDVDFLVDFFPGKKTFKNFMSLALFLDDLCGRKSEVVTKKGLSKYIGPKILSTVVYLFSNWLLASYSWWSWFHYSAYIWCDF